jgi:hypothetical protein
MDLQIYLILLQIFKISIVPGNDYRDNMTYIPEGEYRLIDMFSSYNLNKMDLNVYWKIYLVI